MRASSTLTRTQLRELETELRRDHERLERALQTTNGIGATAGALSSGTNGTYGPGSEDGAISVMVEGRTQVRYDAVVAALARLESGTYGICAACAKPIPFGRLLVMPEATHCVRCGGHG
ncbi:MAG TPA: TraR/DksA C4-type zinc finger protein [Gemmatimonadaceae bacterium]|jgi:RNA polymerase-binding transcription factor DksA|nr:TraR/DksA C4-type zinc finger protein [Gemmatimonadaceae bacterium]